MGAEEGEVEGWEGEEAIANNGCHVTTTMISAFRLAALSAYFVNFELIMESKVRGLGAEERGWGGGRARMLFLTTAVTSSPQ